MCKWVLISDHGSPSKPTPMPLVTSNTLPHIYNPSTMIPITSPMEPQPPPSYTLQARSISYSKHHSFSPLLHILHNVSLQALPSQILAIVGPSGAGKSTLLDILAARTTPTSGSLLLNSSIVKPSSFRKISAYVPQHDVFLPLLTVSETFAFAASLLHPLEKVPSVLSSLLNDLNLSHIANTTLSSSLSGGERRRVSIGLALLHDPRVLLLDEPTSGLDSKSALKVLQIVRLVAVSGHRTVVLSIHQPSFKIISNIDRFLLLSKGQVVHHGDLDSLSRRILSAGHVAPLQLNPLEYAMEILDHLRVDSEPVIEPIRFEPETPQPLQDKSSRTHQVAELSTRLWKMVHRTKQLLLTNTLQALVVGVVLGSVYVNIGLDKQGIEKRFGLFAFTLTFIFSSTTETLPIFINERPILLRETSSGIYKLSSYLIANTLVFVPYLLAIAIIYSASVYFIVGLCATWQAFAYFVLVVWLAILMANSMVLFISALTPNYISGTSLVTALLACFFLFSGYFIASSSMPKYWVFMHFFSMYKYALDALLLNEYSCLASKCFVWYKDGDSCLVSGQDVLVKLGIRGTQRWTNVYVLVGYFVLYRVLFYILMQRRASGSKR